VRIKGFLRVFTPILLGLISLNPIHLAHANGVERGGGEIDGQDLVTAAREGAQWLVRWHEEDRPGYEATPLVEFSDPEVTDLFEKVFRDVDVNLTDQKLRLNGLRKDGINIPAWKLLQVVKSEWLAVQGDPVKRYSFALHEYLAFVRRKYKTLDDRKYQITSLFEAWLRQRLDREAFKTQAGAALTSFAEIMLKQLEADFTLRIASQLKLIKSMTDYEDCVRPLAPGEKPSSTFVECLGVVAMITYVERTQTQLGARERERMDTANAFREVSAFFEANLARMHLSVAEIDKAKRRLRKVIAELSTPDCRGP
jgi:hypothetical protein